MLVSDVTEFKEVEAQRAELNENLQARTVEAETATLVKSQFLANMSHEIRSPMNGILGMLQLLQTTVLSARQGDYAAKAYAATQALLRLLNDIVDFSKLEAGKLTFENALFETDAIVRDVSSLLSASLGTKPVELVFVIDKQLPKRLKGLAVASEMLSSSPQVRSRAAKVSKPTPFGTLYTGKNAGRNRVACKHPSPFVVV